MSSRRLISLFCLSLAAAWCPSAPGAVMHGLYEAQVPVADQGEQQRSAAIHTALNQVLIKVTGDREITTNPKVDDLLNNAEKYLQRFRYQTVAAAAPEGDAGAAPAQQVLLVRFDPLAITRFLRQAQIPVWGRTRPATLVWLAVEQGDDRYILAGDKDAGLQQQIMQQAARRGVTVFLPLFDLEDQQAMSFADLWGNFQQTVVQASQRYQADAILVGRIYRRATDDWQGRWTLYEGHGSSNWQDAGADIDDVVGQGIDGLADTLAQQFAQVISETVKDTVVMEVTNVTSLRDYARVLKYLSDLDLVSQVQVDQVSGDSLYLRLALLGDPGRLAQHIALGTLLEPVPAAAADSAKEDNTLEYRLSP